MQVENPPDLEADLLRILWFVTYSTLKIDAWKNFALKNRKKKRAPHILESSQVGLFIACYKNLTYLMMYPFVSCTRT